jgi:hypothetical protein
MKINDLRNIVKDFIKIRNLNVVLLPLNINKQFNKIQRFAKNDRSIKALFSTNFSKKLFKQRI